MSVWLRGGMVLAIIGMVATAGVAKEWPLPKGTTTWVYRYSDGVPRQIARFNRQAAPGVRFRYLFPYAGAVSFDPVKKQLLLHYSREYVDQYAKSLPKGVLLFPIIDGRSDNGEFDGWADAEYREAARQVAQAILDDPHAAGAQVDIEPFKPGQLPFYKYLRQFLNAKGKHSTMFVGPWPNEVLTGIFQSCDVVVMSGYDLDGDGTPLATYRERLAEGVTRFQATAEATGGHYMVGIPAAASWGEWEYVAGGEAARRESGVKQEDYVRTALEVVQPYRKRSQFVGLALWHMSDPETEFEQPEKAAGATKFPNVIRESVWEMLTHW